MTGDYVSLYLNTAFAQNDLASVLSLMFLFMGRMFPIIALVPFFWRKSLTSPGKSDIWHLFICNFFAPIISGNEEHFRV